MSEQNIGSGRQTLPAEVTNILGEAVVNTMTQETTGESAGYLSAEFINERADFYTDRANMTVLVGCGDDREITDESAEALAIAFPDAMDAREGYASIYGGSIGIAKNVLITGIAQFGPSFVTEIGGLKGAHTKVVHALHKGKMIPTLHSAANNEDSPVAINPAATNGLGCAYAAGVGATSGLIVGPDSLIRDVARADQTRVFGTDERFDDLVNAHEVVLENATEGAGPDFALDRADYAESGAAVMMLAGKPHTAAKGSGLIVNFDSTKVRNSTGANKDGKDFYSNDIAAVTAAVLETFKEYNLDPELLMRAILLDSTPVRAVLASHDNDPQLAGKLDPRNLALGVYGDPQQALSDLRHNQ